MSEYKIIPTDRPKQFRVIGERGLTVGLVTEIREDKHPRFRDWRIELFMRIEAIESSHDQAMAFVRGVLATVSTHNMYTSTRKPEEK